MTWLRIFTKKHKNDALAMKKFGRIGVILQTNWPKHSCSRTELWLNLYDLTKSYKLKQSTLECPIRLAGVGISKEETSNYQTHFVIAKLVIKTHYFCLFLLKIAY